MEAEAFCDLVAVSARPKVAGLSVHLAREHRAQRQVPSAPHGVSHRRCREAAHQPHHAVLLGDLLDGGAEALAVVLLQSHHKLRGGAEHGRRDA